MLFAALVLLLAAAALPVYAADTVNTVVMCAAPVRFPNGVTGMKIIIGVNGMQNAIAMCISKGYTYYYGPTAPNPSAQFGHCSNYTSLNDRGGGALFANGTSSTTCNYGLVALNAPYQFQECYSDMHYYPGPSTGGMFSTAKDAYYTDALAVTDPLACLNTCAAKYGKYAVWSVDPAHPCVCAAKFTATPATCGPAAGSGSGSFSVLRFLGDIPSGLPGYQRRAIAARAAAADTSVCPRGQAACAVSLASGDFECLDTTSELESCGGCLHGGLNLTREAGPIGVDCTAIPGVDPRRVVCRDGRCVVAGCRRGFVNKNGGCEATKARWSL